MKRIFFVLALALACSACHNFKTNFPDYDYTTGYFPYQFPVRILVLGDYIYDNSNDNAGKFVISAAMGGVYSNSKDRHISIVLDESLCDNIYFENGDAIKALPQSYYTLSSYNEIVIPSGKYNGGITVQLTEDFFNDPDAIKNTYVVPLRMTATSDLDSLLSGYSVKANPDVRITSDWDIAPKNFTMFGVKFINEYHGNYFHYGSCSVKMADGTSEEVIYKEEGFNKDVTNNETCLLTTTGRHQCSMDMSLKGSSMTNVSVSMIFDFDGTSCKISAPEGADYTITGSGNYKLTASSDEYNRWSNKDRYYIEFTYTITDAAGNVYTASDYLVARDRAVVLETYTPQL